MKMYCLQFAGFVVLDFKRKGLIGGDWSVQSDPVCPFALAISQDFCGFVWCCQVRVTDRMAGQAQRCNLCVPDAGKGQCSSGHFSWHKQ